MSNKKDFQNKCFSPNWIEIDLEEVAKEQVNREVRLESKRRKDLKTLLKELDEIKQNIEKVAEKQHRLANLMGFYSGDFAQ
jgi:t-SNARE complex subunit (syntaxin)